MLDQCYFCRGKVIQQQVTIDYRWGDTLVVIKDVPAGLCQQCGEKYISSDVYKQLERLAKSKSHLMGKMGCMTNCTKQELLNMSGWVTLIYKSMFFQ